MKSLTARTSPESLAKLFRFKVKMNAAARWRMITIQSLFNPPPSPPPSLPSELPPNVIPSNSPDLSSDSHPAPPLNTLPDPLLNPPPNPPPGPPPGPSSNPPSSLALRVCTIFPGGFDSTSTSSRNVIHSYTPSQFLDLLATSRNANQHVEHTVVNSAWYCKQKTSVLHEFILLQVEDLKVPGLINYIALDRNQRLASSPQGVSNLASCSGNDAADAFRISYNGELREFLQKCQLSKYLTLEQIDFQADASLRIDHLVDLVFRISDQHPRYHPLDTNCYWFTGLIWECLRNMRPTASHKVLLPGKKGRIAFARSVPNPVQVRLVLREVLGITQPANVGSEL